MSKSANYFISGVWKDEKEEITDVMLHAVNDGNNFDIGIKTSETATISLLKQGNVIFTIYWNYPDWELGSKITPIAGIYKEYLRSVSNATTKDNPDNLISMKAIKY